MRRFTVRVSEAVRGVPLVPSVIRELVVIDVVSVSAFVVAFAIPE